jgi:hypothetical protein
MTQELPPGWPAMSLARAHELLTAPGAPFEMAEATIRGYRTRVWKNAPPTLRDVFLAGRVFGGRVFLVHEDERVSFESAFGTHAGASHEHKLTSIRSTRRASPMTAR